MLRWLHQLQHKYVGYTDRSGSHKKLSGSKYRRLLLETLEDRLVPATLYVDNFADLVEVTNHGSTVGVVETGDEVKWDPGAGSAHGGAVGGSGGLFYNQISGGQGAFSSIAAAFAAGSNGDTIKIGPGTFTEFFGSWNKSISVLGNQTGVDARTRTGVPETVMNDTHGAFNITASNVTIDGLTMQGQT